MSMSMQMQLSTRADGDLMRRARVIVYRLRRGEMVTIPPWEHDLQVAVMDMIDAPRPHGAAEGAVPFDWR